MFGKGGMGNLMKQAQMMQERMQKCRKKLPKWKSPASQVLAW